MCYDDQTEVLTDTGFKKFNILLDSDKVAQHTIDGKLEFVLPIIKSEEFYSGNMVKFYTKGKVGRVDLVVTPNSKMIRKSISRELIEVIEARNIKYSSKNWWLQAGKAVGSLDSLSYLDRLRIAFQADGSFASHSDDYTGARSNGALPIRFTLKKDRKVKRLRYILNSLGYSFTEKPQTRGYTHFWIRCPVPMSKIFNWINLEDKGTNWCEEFIKECSVWDGSNPTKDVVMYSSSIESNVNILQSIGVLANRRSTLNKYVDKRENRQSMYTVSLCKSYPKRKGVGIYKEVIPYTGKVCCVAVPSGMIVVKRNAVVSISGDSGYKKVEVLT